MSTLTRLLVFVCLLNFVKAEVVLDDKWTEFQLDEADEAISDGSSISNEASASICPMGPKCQALNRVVISCDTESASAGCGHCLSGFQEMLAPTPIYYLPCIQESASARSSVEEGTVVDNLVADSGRLQLHARADPPLGNGTLVNAGATTHAAVPPAAAPPQRNRTYGDFVFYIIVGTTTSLGLIFIIICAVCWLKYNAVAKQADDDFIEAEFAQRTNGHPGDGKLALSAQMYHYQHQKQQMMALEKSNGESKRSASDVDSDLENEDSDLTTVYECPGLAPTGEMEVRNPFFKEELDNNAVGGSRDPHSAPK